MKDQWIASMEPKPHEWDRHELCEYVWERLSVRKHAFGRPVVNRIIKRCVRRWPVAVMRQCTEQESQGVMRHFAKTLEADERREYGMGIILTFILAAVIQEIVHALVQWWYASHENRLAFARMAAHD
jgi:hypothetical protein